MPPPLMHTLTLTELHAPKHVGCLVVVVFDSQEVLLLTSANSIQQSWDLLWKLNLWQHTTQAK